MKYLLKLLVLIFMIHASSFANEKGEVENRYIETLALTFKAFARGEGESIWPQFRLSDQAGVFHFQNGHVYAIGLARSSLLWEKRMIQSAPVLFCPQYPVSLPPFQPAFPVEGQQAFVFSLDPNPDDSFLPILTFIHERFHIYQFQAFGKEEIAEPIVTDYQDADLLAWMEVENRLLVLFLQASESERKVEYLKDYIAVNQMRRHSLHPDSIKWEDHQQRMEGLADYVSVKTFQMIPCISDFNPEEYLLQMRKKKNRGLVSSAQDAMKGRHYFVGAVLGWALDFCRINWKFEIEKENVSLQAILESYFPMDEKEKLKRCDDVKRRLNWIEIRDQIAQQLEIAKKEVEKVMQDFSSQEGIVIKMGTPSGHMSSGGRHQKSYQIDNQKALMGDTSVTTSQDQSWSLRFTNIPIVFEEQNGDRTFKLNPEVKLQLDEKEVSLKEILQGDPEVPFSSLSLKDGYCELISKRSGKLCVEQDFIFVKFN